MRFTTGTLTVTLALLATACNLTEPKDKGFRELQAVEHRWSDGIQLASATSRIALSTPVSQLQSIRRDLDALTVGACLQPAKDMLKEHMDYMIEGFVAFMGDNKYESERKIKKAAESLEGYKSARDKCSS